MAGRKTLEIERSWTGQFLWRFKSTNGTVVSNGESYASKQSAISGSVLGSPVVSMTRNEDGSYEMWYYEPSGDDGTTGEFLQGNVTELDNYEDANGVRKSVPEGDAGIQAAAHVVSTRPDIMLAVESDFRLLDDGHSTMNNLVFHPKHPDLDRCALPFCQMSMKVDATIEPPEGFVSERH